MKYFLILILMVNATAYSQELSYSIYLRDVCNDSIYKSTYFSLAEIKNDTGLDCINGTCTLSQAGTYKLLLLENVSDIPSQIDKYHLYVKQ
ncbi:MAG: hypothetical protein KTR26_01905 [Flammeovirgaceae bacterium]|nr:hypothetical protein [Flammeovirgaceae bacterium]